MCTGWGTIGVPVISLTSKACELTPLVLRGALLSVDLIYCIGSCSRLHLDQSSLSHGVPQHTKTWKLKAIKMLVKNSFRKNVLESDSDKEVQRLLKVI